MRIKTTAYSSIMSLFSWSFSWCFSRMWLDFLFFCFFIYQLTFVGLHFQQFVTIVQSCPFLTSIHTFDTCTQKPAQQHQWTIVQTLVFFFSIHVYYYALLFTTAIMVPSADHFVYLFVCFFLYSLSRVVFLLCHWISLISFIRLCVFLSHIFCCCWLKKNINLNWYKKICAKYSIIYLFG